MSSFALLTQDGPPNLLVEVGEPISGDPILLSGLFRAISTLSGEVTDTPIQIIQTKGYTIEFSYLDEGFLLVVGTDHTIIGLDGVLKEIKAIVVDGIINGIVDKEISPLIKTILQNYVEATSTQEQDSGVSLALRLTDAFRYLPMDIIKVIIWGGLTNHPFRYPKTPSADYNKFILEIIEYFDLKLCSAIDTTCSHAIEFISREADFKIEIVEYRKKNNLIYKTNILKKLQKLAKKGRYVELRERIIVHRSSLNSFLHLLENYSEKSEQVKNEIENLRFLIGEELEHYLLYQLQIKDPLSHQLVVQNTNQFEWISDW